MITASASERVSAAATELVVDSDLASGVDAVDAVGTAVGAIPATSKCLSSEDVFG